MSGSVPLAVVERGGRTECVHHGAVAVVDADGRLRYAAGDPGLPLYLRSAAKPFQAIPLVESGGADRLELTDEEIAVICASHAAEAVHVAAVRSILSKAGCEPAQLRCGAHPPHDPAQAALLAREGRVPEAVHNNCSGKHAGMLAACRTHGWPVETYLDPAHPLQREIASAIAQCCGAAEPLPVATDGCGVPTFHADVRQTALAFARLADPRGLPARRAAAVVRIARAMMAHPVMISGTGRPVTDLMAVFRGRVVSKGGAEAVLGVGLPDRGWGIGVKIEDGNNRAMGAVIAEVLRQLGVASSADLDAFAAHARPIVRNHHRQAVGAIRPLVTLEAPRVSVG